MIDTQALTNDLYAAMLAALEKGTSVNIPDGTTVADTMPIINKAIATEFSQGVAKAMEAFVKKLDISLQTNLDVVVTSGQAVTGTAFGTAVTGTTLTDGHGYVTKNQKFGKIV